MKVIIVGGVAGGATAAARLRRLDETAEIVVFERSGYVSYANCGLPYYIGGVITDKEELTLQTPESFWRRFRVDMRVRHEVTAIHPAEKTVDVRNLATGETFTESYDKLVLSPGARPTQPALPGVGIDRLFTLRTVEDTLKIREFIEQHHPRSAVLAGGGFIGVELMGKPAGAGHRRHRGPAAPPAAESPGRGHDRLPPRQAAAKKGCGCIWAALWRALPPTVTGSMCC